MLHSSQRQVPHAANLSQKKAFTNRERWGREEGGCSQERNWRDDSYDIESKAKDRWFRECRTRKWKQLKETGKTV